MAGVNGFLPANHFATANPGGPAGSSVMTFFCVITCLKNEVVGYQVPFNRYIGTAAGWSVWRQTSTGVIYASVVNSTPDYVITPLGAPPTLHTPLLFIVTYNNGRIEGWINGVSTGATTLGTGYTAAAGPTVIGTSGTGGRAYPCRYTTIHEAGMLDGVDLSASIAAVNAQWTEDLQQGRYLTWPRAAVANSDWYWSARDAVLGVGGCAPTWTDRYSASVMTRTGAPQSASVPGRFA